MLIGYYIAFNEYTPEITIMPAITEHKRTKKCTKFSLSCRTITFNADMSYLKYKPGIP